MRVVFPLVMMNGYLHVIDAEKQIVELVLDIVMDY